MCFDVLNSATVANSGMSNGNHMDVYENDKFVIPGLYIHKEVLNRVVCLCVYFRCVHRGSIHT